MSIRVRGGAPLPQVFDMPASIAFYRDVLGFEVVSTDRPGEPWDRVWLRVGAVDRMLNPAYEADARPPAPDPARIAAHQDTCIYFGSPDVDAAYAYRRAGGGRAGAHRRPVRDEAAVPRRSGQLRPLLPVAGGLIGNFRAADAVSIP